jgi:hypothetical protein
MMRVDDPGLAGAGAAAPELPRDGAARSAPERPGATSALPFALPRPGVAVAPDRLAAPDLDGRAASGR